MDGCEEWKRMIEKMDRVRYLSPELTSHTLQEEYGGGEEEEEG